MRCCLAVSAPEESRAARQQFSEAGQVGQRGGHRQTNNNAGNSVASTNSLPPTGKQTHGFPPRVQSSSVTQLCERDADDHASFGLRKDSPYGVFFPATGTGPTGTTV